MNLAEYIKGFLGIIAIIFFGIGIVVWKFRAADEIQEIEKENRRRYKKGYRI